MLQSFRRRRRVRRLLCFSSPDTRLGSYTRARYHNITKRITINKSNIILYIIKANSIKMCCKSVTVAYKSPPFRRILLRLLLLRHDLNLSPYYYLISRFISSRATYYHKKKNYSFKRTSAQLFCFSFRPTTISIFIKRLCVYACDRSVNANNALTPVRDESFGLIPLFYITYLRNSKTNV